MSDKKKKIFPKIKKKLKSFLTDESGKITKKDALGLSAAGLLLTWANDASAAVTTWTVPAGLPFPNPADPNNHNNSVAPTYMTVSWPATCSHASGIVNWHYSAVPNVNQTQTQYELHGHGSHGSHGSHGQW